jgi:glutamate N-acetyltransferase/amino-acid N-acetyltransferase
VASTDLVFSSSAEHHKWLATQSPLPSGFQVGTTTFEFTPREAPKPSKMTISVIALDEPTENFAAVFTKNAFPGAPVVIGRQRLGEKRLRAIVINNKVSNVCAPDGVESAEAVCAKTAESLGCGPKEILPSSTGVIGWSLPIEAMTANLPRVLESLQTDSVFPAAKGIMTTDLYPKVRRVSLAGGSIVGIAKGAGMIEPNLATMLVYVLTDFAVPRKELRSILSRVVDATFNRISIDSDTSTSDTVALVSSGNVPCPDLDAFEKAVLTVCGDLAEDVVRNGEGVQHVIRVRVTNAPDEKIARGTGKAIVNAPLFKCAIAGNDPNVGRLVQAIGKYVGEFAPDLDLSAARLAIGGVSIFSDRAFQLDNEKESLLAEHLKQAQLYRSAPTTDGVFTPPVDFPTHERCVEIDVDLDCGTASAETIGGDLTHEYVTENADYRS